MRPGFFGGFLTGVALSAAVLGAVSVLTGMATDAPPRAASPEVPAGSEFRQSREDREAEMPAADELPGAAGAPVVTPPAPDDLSSLRQADTAPAAAPETDGTAARLGTPQVQGASPGVAVDSDEPVLPSPQALPPEAPEAEAGPSISTEPAQPPQPDVEAGSGLFGEGDPASAAAAASAADTTPPATQPAVAADAEAAPARKPAAGDVAAQDSPATSDVETGGETATIAASGGDDEPPSGTIGNLAAGVTTGRLPAVIDKPVAAADGPAAEIATVPALERFAAAFDNPGGKPLMAIVLIDDGQSPVSHEALADFPYPISYAIDASWPGAAAAAARYRAAGLEVLAMVDLPEAASARDAEVAMATYLAAVPQAVAVMEGTGTGLQASRAAALQLVPILQDSGHGLVLFSEGLDTVRKLIAREGVPVAPVFRDFDGEGQDSLAIRRLLDRAAFRAGQVEAGGVVMVGRLRAESVSALVLWGLQDRAASVALAPVSAVLEVTRKQ